jgi:uncharacterized protein YodC (DUF2158 family)
MIKPGDIVKLKSGGPRMTVCVIKADTHVECRWFDPTLKIQWAIFTRDALKPHRKARR